MLKKLMLYSVVLITTGCNNAVETQTSLNEIVAQNPNRIYNVGFLIVDGVYNSELVAPMDILHHTVFHTEKGMKVFTVAPDSLPITTFEGLRIIPDYAYKYNSIPPIDVLVVPSAEHSMDTDLDNIELINFVKTIGERAEFVMSLCDGAFVLAKAGLLENKVCTTFPADITRFREMFTSLDVRKDVSFVHDGKLITSIGGAKSYDPALYLCELLYGNKVAKGVAGGLVIDWNVHNIKHLRME